MTHQQSTPSNKELYAETKHILDNINEDEFDISVFINKLEGLKELKEKKQKPVTWTPDEWDDWYGG